MTDDLEPSDWDAVFTMPEPKVLATLRCRPEGEDDIVLGKVELLKRIAKLILEEDPESDDDVGQPYCTWCTTDSNKPHRPDCLVDLAHQALA